MNIDLICKIVNGSLNKKKYGKKTINNFTIDSRITTKNDCFITINEGYKYVNKNMGLIITDKDLDLKVPIIKVENTNLGTFNAIVLDTGSAMKKDWNKGIVHMDLAFKTENDPAVNLATGNNIKYSIKRWGY